MAREEAARRLAAWLWRRWRPTLSALGVSAGGFRGVVLDAAQEVWLWVMGDRPFDQVLAAIAGRTLRRFPR